MAKVTVLTNGGEDWAAQRLAGSGALSTLSGRYIGWGTGAGTSAKSDTVLFTEATEARATGIVTVESSGAAAKWQCEGTLTADAPKTITNAGAFSANTGGTLIVHTSFDGIALNEDDQITFTFSIDPS